MQGLFPAHERGLICHSHQAKVTSIPNEVVCTRLLFSIFFLEMLLVW